MGLTVRRHDPERLDQGGERRTASGRSRTDPSSAPARPRCSTARRPTRTSNSATELKINDHGNSGVYFRSPTADGDFGKGYEAQVDSTHRDPIRTGSLYTFIHIFEQLVPPDTWFTYEIEVVTKDFRGNVIPHIKVSINGKLLYEFLDHNDTWKEGYFAFQQHDPGSRVEIRKIEVLELP